MIGVELPAQSVDDVVRVVRALGAHRYVAGRLHLLHAAAIAAACADGVPEALAEAHAWAQGVLADRALDPSSRDERLHRKSTDAEVAAVIERFFRPGPARDRAREALMQWMEDVELPLGESDPFDPDAEEDMHPVLIDAGWELLPLAGLDPERHKGAIAWFGEPIQFETAVFEEETAIPPPVYLEELSAFGAMELLFGADDDGALHEPLTVWTDGDERYHEYVLAGVRRAAKLVDPA